MMIGLFKDEITSKINLLMWNPTITSNVLISCVERLEKRLQPSMTLTSTNISFFTKTNLSCCTNPLSMKHIDALKSRNVWAIATSLLDLIITSNKLKHGDGFKNKSWPFSLFISTSWSLLRLDILLSQVLKLWVGNRSGPCYMLTLFFLTFTSNMASFSII